MLLYYLLRLSFWNEYENQIYDLFLFLKITQYIEHRIKIALFLNN